MRHHIAHLYKVEVSNSQLVKKGQQIGLLGNSGTKWAHVHYEIQKIFRNWTSYTSGMSKAQVLQHYADPRPYEKTVLPTFDHYGWYWLDNIGGGKLHPGTDLNGKGSGNADLKQPVYAPVSGKVVAVRNDSGWGNHIFIDEGETGTTMGQVSDWYKRYGDREPNDNDKQYFGHWEKQGELKFAQEIVPKTLAAKNAKISELENRPPEIKEVEKIVFRDKLETLEEIKVLKAEKIDLNKKITFLKGQLKDWGGIVEVDTKSSLKRFVELISLGLKTIINKISKKGKK